MNFEIWNNKLLIFISQAPYYYYFLFIYLFVFVFLGEGGKDFQKLTYQVVSRSLGHRI